MKELTPNNALTAWHWTIRTAKQYFEGLFWLGGLLYLAFSHPSSNTHFSFCIFNWLGFEHCPGCGLGRSISYLFHGELYSSLAAHPLGIIALLVLTWRIYFLLAKSYHKKYAGLETDR